MGVPNIRIAVLADIHGNMPALTAVLGKLEELQPDYVIVNGDLINAVPFSADVVELIRAKPWTVVRGNHEFYYLDFGTERAAEGSADPTRWGGLHWLVEQITPSQGAFLAMLPDDCSIYLPGTQPLRVAHGVPGRNRVGFYHGQSADDIVKDIDNIELSTVLSAHTHVQVDRHICRLDGEVCDLEPRVQHHGSLPTVQTAQHWHVVNPGSVGLPLNGSPTVQFAIIESVPESEEPGGWKAMHYQVPYDRRPALEAFYTSGLLEAGGVIAELFYWELVTAEPEIILYYRWARARDLDPDSDMVGVFEQYATRSGRRRYVRAKDPLYSSTATK